MGERDEVLANFQVRLCALGLLPHGRLPPLTAWCSLIENTLPQAFTGLEDVGMCIEILEQKGWDLMVRCTPTTKLAVFVHQSHSHVFILTHRPPLTVSCRRTLVQWLTEEVEVKEEEEEGWTVGEGSFVTPLS